MSFHNIGFERLNIGFGNCSMHGYLKPVTGVSPLTLTKCMSETLKSFTISGNSVQDTTPVVDAPVEMHGVGEECENGYNIPVKYSGLNLTNVINKTQLSNFSLNVYVEAGKPYSIKLDDFSGGWNLRIYPTKTSSGSGYLESIYVSGNFYTFTPTEGGYLAINGFALNGVAFNCSTIMVVEGQYSKSTMPSYEQYYEPVTHNVYIPEPLYGSEGIYDTVAVDYSNKTAEVEKQCYKYVMTGDEINITGGSNSYGTVYGFRLPTGFSRMAETTVLCNYCETPAGSHSVDNPSESVFNTTLAINKAGVDNYMYFFVPNTIFSGIDVESDSYTSYLCERFVAWLKERYAQGNPVEVVYRLNKSISTDVSVMQAWESVPKLNKGTTIITVETETDPSAMTVEYYSRAKG